MDANLKAELDKMGQPMSVLEEPRYLRALLYGDPGSGKTDLAAKLVENKGALFSTDSAWVTILKYPELAAKWTKYDFEGFSQLKAFVQAHNEGIEPYCTYDTLLWDTASTGIDIVLRRLVDSKKFDAKHQIDPLVEGWPHYRIVERALRDTVKELSKSKLNIIYTAHIKDPSENDKARKRFAIRPNAPEASFKVLAQEVQLIGWLHKGKPGEPRLIQVEGTVQETAKSQISTIKETTYQVNQIPELIKKWKQGQ